MGQSLIPQVSAEAMRLNPSTVVPPGYVPEQTPAGLPKRNKKMDVFVPPNWNKSTPEDLAQGLQPNSIGEVSLHKLIAEGNPATLAALAEGEVPSHLQDAVADHLQRSRDQGVAGGGFDIFPQMKQAGRDGLADLIGKAGLAKGLQLDINRPAQEEPARKKYIGRATVRPLITGPRTDESGPGRHRQANIGVTRHRRPSTFSLGKLLSPRKRGRHAAQ